MATRKITKKVISKKETVSVQEAAPEVEQKQEEVKPAAATKKTCFFCQSKTNPSYTDMNVLRRYTTDRTKIVPRIKSNLCSKHQRVVTKHIKYARHLALLSFTPQV